MRSPRRSRRSGRSAGRPAAPPPPSANQDRGVVRREELQQPEALLGESHRLRNRLETGQERQAGSLCRLSQIRGAARAHREASTGRPPLTKRGRAARRQRSVRWSAPARPAPVPRWRRCPASDAPAAVDHVHGASGEARLVAGEVDSKRCDLVGRAETAGWLALQEELARIRPAAEAADALVE